MMRRLRRPRRPALTWASSGGDAGNKAERLEHPGEIAASTKNEPDIETHLYGRVVNRARRAQQAALLPSG